jgi:DNA primase
MQERTKRESMMALNEFAGRYFVNQLWKTEEGQSVGLAYFRERGFSDAILQKFQLGYSQNQYHAFADEAIKSGFSSAVLNDVGLATRSDKGGMVDRFRGRVMFPVHSLSGRIVAFGGRVLVQTDKSAKYVNSPESEIYHKSNELYGIYFAKESIVQLINACAAQVDPQGPSVDLAKAILATYENSTSAPTMVAISFLKTELKTYFSA